MGPWPRAVLCVLALPIAVLPSRVARADEEFLDQRDPEDVREEQAALERGPKHWYGGELLIADGLLVAGMLLSTTQDTGCAPCLPRSLFYTAFGAWVAAGPVLHAAHGNWRSTAWSTVFRLGVTLVTGWLVSKANISGDPDDMFRGRPESGLHGVDHGDLMCRARRPKLNTRGSPLEDSLVGSVRPPSCSAVGAQEVEMGRHSILIVVMAASLLAGSVGVAGAQTTHPEPTAPATAASAEAIRLTLTGGRVVEGARVGEDATYYTVNSFTDGLVRARKADVARLDRIRETDDEDDFVDEVASRPAPRGRRNRPSHHRSRRHDAETPDPHDDERFIDEVASLPPPCDGRCPAATEESNRLGAELAARTFVLLIDALLSNGQH